MKNTVLSLPINRIVINDRARKDPGNIEALAASIESVGLLHPIVVTNNNELIAGERRLLAFQYLHQKHGGRDYLHIPANIIDNYDEAYPLLIAERDENTCRKDFAPSEAVALGKRLEEIEKPNAAARQGQRTDLEHSGKLPEGSKGQTRDKVGAAVGMSGKTYEKAKEVVEYAQEHKLPEVIELMDTKSVSAAVKEVKNHQRKEERAKVADKFEEAKKSDRWNIYNADMATWKATKRYDFIITDPPYLKEYLPLYKTLAVKAREWLKPGGLLIAMCGQSYLNEIYAMMSEHLDYYWTGAYMTPGQPTPLRARQVNTTWKPLLFFRYNVDGDKYNGKIFGDVFTSDKNEKELHKWGQSVSGMKSIVSMVCLPGQSILDPFAGAGTTGIAALSHGCFFDGIEIDEENCNISKGRLSEHDQKTQ